MKLKVVLCLLIMTSCITVKDDENTFTFSPEVLPGMTISGIIASENNIKILYITKVRLFSNWDRGWTEGFFEASGKYQIEVIGNGYRLTEIDPFELWGIISGEIRYNDTYFRGDDGLWKVKNRIDRLKEISRILMENSSDYLTANIYTYLFPELYKFNLLEKEGSLPKAYYDADLTPEIIKGSGISWRSDYTRSVFPQQIWPLRDSGTLYRDIQEAPDIFESIYNLKEYFKNKELVL